MKRSTDEIMEIMERIIDEYEGAEDRYNRDQWSSKFGEKFAPYEDKLKKLNGDDFDIMKESYDEYHKDYSDLSDDDYANSLEENIKKVLARIWPEEPEKVEQATEEVVQSTEGEDKPEEGTALITNDPEVAEGVTKDVIDEAEEDPVASFTKELEAYKGRK